MSTSIKLMRLVVFARSWVSSLLTPTTNPHPLPTTTHRKFLNIGEVCTYAHWAFGIKGRIAQSDSWKFCDRVRVAFESDLLVALHSSHMVVELLFAKPGSLIIDVSSFNFRRPGLKSLANLCGISYLEFLTIDKVHASVCVL